jgi:hypothetical protein
MKTYFLLLLVSAPLLYVAATETKSLGEGYLNKFMEGGAKAGGESQLKTAKADVKKFAKIDRSVLDGALGYAALPEDLGATGSGLELTLSEKYASYAKGEATAKKFVEAYQSMTVLPADKLGDANAQELRALLMQRKQMSKDEKEFAGLVGSSSIDAARQDRLKKYAASEYSDTALAKALVYQGTRWNQPDGVRNGSILVLVLKTRDLMDEKDTAAALDQVLRSIADQTETRDKLIGGTFCLVTSNPKPPDGRPDRRLADWPGADYMGKDSAGVFDRADGRTAFVRALEAADSIARLRPGNKIAAVRIIYRSDVAPTGRNDPIPIYETVVAPGTQVGVHWINADGRDTGGEALKKWFSGEVTPYGRGDSLTQDLPAGLMDVAARP